MPSPHEESPVPAAANWEAFYANYRKPGYVRGFEITTKLGAGMFGLVYKATRQSIGKDYAIKFLKVDDGEVRRAVLQELEQVRHFAQVDHPNLVAIEDRGEVDGIPYVVMNFAGSETLRNRLPGDAASRNELLNLLMQAFRGVAALHERSLVHFDLKPANVFLKGGVARVGDYGLSKLVTHSQRSMSMGRGTPYYMAPEMLKRKGDHRSDIYSLGVMLYEALCGDVPFKGDSEWEVLKKHETALLVFPQHVDARYCDVVRRCMQKNPDLRYQSVAELLAALGAPVGAGAASVASVRGVEPVVSPLPIAPAASTTPVPPPLPGDSVRRDPPAPMPMKKRSSSAPQWIALGFLVVIALGLMSLREGPSPVQRFAVTSPVHASSIGGASSEPSWLMLAREDLEAARATLEAEMLEFEARTNGSVKLLGSELNPLPMWTEEERAQLPTTEERVRSLARSTSYDERIEEQLIKQGRGALLVAVRELLDCDLGAFPVSPRALHLQQFLQNSTGVHSIELEADPLESRSERRSRNAVAVSEWAEWLCRFAPSDEAWTTYQQLRLR